MNKPDSIAKLITSTLLRIGALEFNPEKPFLLASQKYGPAYCDIRKLYGSSKYRRMVTEGYSKILLENDLYDKITSIVATSLSGIAPAVSLGHLIKKPVIILQNGTFYRLKISFEDEFPPMKFGEDIIFATAPWAIPKGVLMANHYELPFAYIRPYKKEHGKGNKIEGIVHKGQNAFVLYIEAETFKGEIEMILSEVGVKTKSSECISFEEARTHLQNLRNETVVVIEDLITTGGSSLELVHSCKNAGGNVLGVVSVFNYLLNVSEKNFLEAKCPLYSIADYNNWLDVAMEEHTFSKDQFRSLNEWHSDPLNWGEKHGHVLAEVK